MKQHTFTRNLSDKIPIENQRVLCMDKQHWFVGYYLEGRWYREGFVSPIKNKVILWYEIPKHFKDLTPGQRLHVISEPLPEKDRRRMTNRRKYKRVLRLINKLWFLSTKTKLNRNFIDKAHNKARNFILDL